MSPDDRALARQIDHLVIRAWFVTALESAALGVAVAAWSRPAGLGVAVLASALRARMTSRRAVVRRLERASPALGNVLVTAQEILDGSLSVAPHVAERVFREAALAVDHADARPIWRPWRVLIALLLAAGIWTAHAAFSARATSSTADRGVAVRTGAAATPGELRVTVKVQPPAYTRLPETMLTNPADVRAIENSELEFSIQSPARDVAIEIDGVTRTPSTGPDGARRQSAVATRSGYALVTANGTRRLMTLTIVPDALPTVRIVAPGKDLVLGGGNPRLTFEVHGRDDFGLKSLSLRFTKVSGSGEQFEFKEGEIPLSIERTSASAWTGRAVRALVDFGLAEGDMLVYRGVASDERPGAGEAASDAYFIELSRLGAAAGDAFTLPAEETRYALSQQMLIMKTERLIRDQRTLGADDVAEISKGLAIEQRMIRSEFVFMLGGEIEDEAIEAELSTELQEGRLANRGQRDLREATVAMSLAEKHLTDANPDEALKAERAAVTALQRAFARDRYILRSLATRNPLDRTRRLTGTIGDAIGWRRQLRAVEESRRTRIIVDLLQGLGELASDSTSTGVERRNRLSMLAELALRSDPESDAMRQAAANLQKLSDSWTSLDTAGRARQLDAVAGDVAAEARRAMADPPAIVGGAR